MQLDELDTKTVYAYRPKADRPAAPYRVVDKKFTPQGQQGQVLISPVDPTTGDFVNGPTLGVGVAAIVSTWDDWLATEKKELLEFLTGYRRPSEIAQEIIDLVGAKDGEVRLSLNVVTGEITFTPERLLALVKAARRTALDEFEGKGGRFGPAPV